MNNKCFEAFKTKTIKEKILFLQMKIQNTPPMCSFLSDLTVLNIINGYNAFSFFINLQPKLQFTLIYHMQMLAPCPILLLLFLLTPLL